MTARYGEPVLPGLVRHADWSVSPAKRWVVDAHRGPAGSYRIEAPEPVGRIDRLSEGSGATMLLGVDFPIGLPLHYARRAGITSFRAWLADQTPEQWHELSRVAALPSEIALARPFYPARPGRARQHHLVEGLGAHDMAQLRRACECAPPLRRPAGTLFWTLGANQVGRAATVGWNELIRPLLDDPTAGLWPFDGSLAELLGSRSVVVAEAYPAELGHHLRLGRVSKRTIAGRAACGRRLCDVADELEVELSPAARHQIERGFDNDDAFDAFVGALGMINVLRGHRPADPPVGMPGVPVEGWILGAG